MSKTFIHTTLAAHNKLSTFEFGLLFDFFFKMLNSSTGQIVRSFCIMKYNNFYGEIKENMHEW